MHEERADGCKCIKSNKRKPQISIVMPAEILVLIRFILSYFPALSQPHTHTQRERERAPVTHQNGEPPSWPRRK